MATSDLIQISSEIQTCAGLLLKFFSASLEQRLEDYGVPMSGLQYAVLRMVQPEALTISTLSQRLGLDPSALVRMIDSLERKGLVKRGVDPHDRRRNPIEITKNGMRLLAAVPVVSETDPTFRAVRSLGPASAAQLRDLLIQVIEEFPEGKLVSQLMSGHTRTEARPPAARGRS